MATWDDVRRITLDLPETSERADEGVLQWRVREKLLTWERPLRRSDYQAIRDAAPEGDILAVWVGNLGVREALLTDDPEVSSPLPTSTDTRPFSSVSSRSRCPSWRS